MPFSERGACCLRKFTFPAHVPKRAFYLAGGLLVCLVLCAGWFLFGAGCVFASGTASRLELGERYLLEQDYHQAQIQFAAVMEAQPQTVEAYLGHGLASYALGNVSDFEQDYSTLLEIAPEQTTAIQNWRDAVMRGVLLQEDYFSSSGGNCAIRYTYNLYGQRAVSVTDYDDETQEDVTTRYAYNDQGQMVRATVYRGDSQSESHHIDYTYDAIGNIISATCTQSDGSVSYISNYSYNSDNLLLAIESSGSNAFVRSYSFDSSGNCVEEVYESQAGNAGADSTTVYTYLPGATECGFTINPYGELDAPLYVSQSQTGELSPSIWQWTCDPQGRCLTKTSDDSHEENTYDSFGRIVTNQCTYGTQMQYSYGSRYLYGDVSQALAIG